MFKHPHASSIPLNIFILLCLIFGGFASPSPAQADSTITVATSTAAIDTGDGLCSLTEAITNANDDNQYYTDCVAGSGNDTIQFNDALGTTTITLLSTLPNITDLDGLTINGGGDITINGNNTYQIFSIQSSVPFSLNSLILVNGQPAINNNNGTLTITNSTFSGNSGTYGGAIANTGILSVTNSILSGNSSTGGGGGSGIYNSGTATITMSIFSNNTGAGASRGSIYSSGTATIANSTFTGNITTGSGCCNGAGAIYNQGTMTILNSTFSGNGTMTSGGGADIYQLGTGSALHLYNNILANSSGEQNCRLDFDSGTVDGNNNLIETHTGCTTTSPLTSDPDLGTLTGSPGYFPLNASSPAIDAGDDAICAAAPVSNSSQNGATRPQGAHCDIGAYEYSPNASIGISISGNSTGSYVIAPGNHLLQSYPGTSGGPVFVDSTNNVPVVSSLRLLYNNKTFSELMGVPTDQLSNDYWLPYYANISGTDTQIRFTNTHETLSTTVNVYLGSNPTAVYTKVLAASSTDRINLPSGTTGGPVHIVGTGGINILAGMRVIYGGNKSFDELMAFPTAELSTEYWFPFYNHNNVNLDTQVRVANTSSTTSAPVNIYIGDTLMDTTTIAPLSAYLKSFPGVNGGPVRVVSTSGTPVPIVASLRLLYNNKTFSELMGVPTSQLSNDYWLPYYANIPGTDTQIRFTNTSDTLSTTVNVYLGSNPTPVYTNTLLPETADRFNLPSGTTGGPVHIVGTSGVNILAGMRVIYGGNSSFDELMAYPDAMLSAEYWFPFYNHNNVNLNTELRIGVP